MTYPTHTIANHPIVTPGGGDPPGRKIEVSHAHPKDKTSERQANQPKPTTKIVITPIRVAYIHTKGQKEEQESSVKVRIELTTLSTEALKVPRRTDRHRATTSIRTGDRSDRQ